MKRHGARPFRTSTPIRPRRPGTWAATRASRHWLRGRAHFEMVTPSIARNGRTKRFGLEASLPFLAAARFPISGLRGERSREAAVPGAEQDHAPGNPGKVAHGPNRAGSSSASPERREISSSFTTSSTIRGRPRTSFPNSKGRRRSSSLYSRSSGVSLSFSTSSPETWRRLVTPSRTFAFCGSSRNRSSTCALNSAVEPRRAFVSPRKSGNESMSAGTCYTPLRLIPGWGH